MVILLPSAGLSYLLLLAITHNRTVIMMVIRFMDIQPPHALEYEHQVVI
jgi:hypothetical protein